MMPFNKFLGSVQQHHFVFRTFLNITIDILRKLKDLGKTKCSSTLVNVPVIQFNSVYIYIWRLQMQIQFEIFF